MTDEQAEIFTALYALGDAIRLKNWPEALGLWERLLNLYAPLAEWHPHLATVLRNNTVLVQMAERQSNKVH
jgi:hypothetical protein